MSPRADATRNRDALLSAAAELTAKNNEAPSLAELASSAGLGVGTVYRHFPTREALSDALAEGQLKALRDAARHALDADDALESFLRVAIEKLASDSNLAAAFTRADDQRELLEVFAQLVDRAREAGMVRADLTALDIHRLVCGIQLALRLGGDPRTYTDVLLAGLKPEIQRTIGV